MLKQTSATAGYSGLCSNARNARIVLEISGNSGGTSCFVHVPLLMTFGTAYCLYLIIMNGNRDKIKAYKVYMERNDVYMPEALKYYTSVTFIELQDADVL
jgi:hypothetical protein